MTGSCQCDHNDLYAADLKEDKFGPSLSEREIRWLVLDLGGGREREKERERGVRKIISDHRNQMSGLARRGRQGGR